MPFQAKVYLVTTITVASPMRTFASLLKSTLFIAKHEQSLYGWRLFRGALDDVSGLEEITADARKMVDYLRIHIPTYGDEPLCGGYDVAEDSDHKRFKYLRLDRCKDRTTRI